METTVTYATECLCGSKILFATTPQSPWCSTKCELKAAYKRIEAYEESIITLKSKQVQIDMLAGSLLNLRAKIASGLDEAMLAFKNNKSL